MAAVKRMKQAFNLCSSSEKFSDEDKDYILSLIHICPSNWETGCVEDIAEFFDSMRKPLSSLERTDMERIYPYYGAVSIVD